MPTVTLLLVWPLKGTWVISENIGYIWRQGFTGHCFWNCILRGSPSQWAVVGSAKINTQMLVHPLAKVKHHTRASPGVLDSDDYLKTQRSAALDPILSEALISFSPYSLVWFVIKQVKPWIKDKNPITGTDRKV